MSHLAPRSRIGLHNLGSLTAEIIFAQSPAEKKRHGGPFPNTRKAETCRLLVFQNRWDTQNHVHHPAHAYSGESGPVIPMAKKSGPRSSGISGPVSIGMTGAKSGVHWTPIPI